MQMEKRIQSDRSPQTQSTCAGYATRHTVEGTAIYLAYIATCQVLINLKTVGPNLGNKMLLRAEKIAQSDLKKANPVEGKSKTSDKGN